MLLAADTRDIKRQAMAFADWCEQESVDIVMGVNSEAILSALPHLPERIRVLARCANGFGHGYRITLSGKDRLARIVAVTPRLAHDLINLYGADPSIVKVIPNGIDPAPFDEAAKTKRGEQPELRLGFLGRLEDNQKGVFHLPRIVRELNKSGIDFKLRIAGKGRHRRILEKEMSKESRAGQIEFLGSITPNQVPQFLAEIDVFLFTSHFEGCPNALLEAMMAGCVPVSWMIEGITDFIVREQETGFVCPLGDHVRFAQCIKTLAKDRNRLRAMSNQASTSARDRFTHHTAASAYADLIKEVMDQEPPPWILKPWHEFAGDPNFDHSWRDHLQDIPLVQWVWSKMRA